MKFEWQRLEAKGWGLLKGTTPIPAGFYGGFFDLFKDGDLRRNDSDAAHRFGGVVRLGADKKPLVSGEPIKELQEDLTRVGYDVGTPDGVTGRRRHLQ